MIYNLTSKKVIFPRELTEEQKIMFLYRYVSLLITSIFYLIAPINHTIDRRLFIIACIGISSLILNNIYIVKNDNVSIIKLLVFIETIGNSIILIPSGGLNSPYVWYALNTIFIAAVMLEWKYFWLNLLAYLVASTWMTYYIFNDKQQGFIAILEQQSNLIMSFILITIAIYLLLRYIREIKQERIKLLKTNTELIAANHQVKESVNHIMELYQAVHLFSNMKNKNELIEIILEYTKRIVTTDMIVFYNYEKRENTIGTVSSEECKRISELLHLKVLEIWQDLENTNTAVELIIEDRCFLVISVKSSYMTYGILGVEIKPKKESFNQIESMDQMKFLADLSSIVLEKFDLGKINEKLIITEEQNRIANEIHDSVLQRLFSTSCGIYGLMKKLNKANIRDADSDLNSIRDTVEHVMKELRTAIYGLSWKKDGTDNFVSDLTNYINDIKMMNRLDIDLNIIGNSEHIARMPKKAIYRIICEGIGNAFRHGKANNIEITLNIKVDSTQLRIEDNGTGFDFDLITKSKQNGLGISNIRFLVGSLRGKLDYQSTIGKGTIINIVIPNRMNDVREDKVV